MLLNVSTFFRIRHYLKYSLIMYELSSGYLRDIFGTKGLWRMVEDGIGLYRVV